MLPHTGTPATGTSPDVAPVAHLAGRRDDQVLLLGRSDHGHPAEGLVLVLQLGKLSLDGVRQIVDQIVPTNRKEKAHVHDGHGHTSTGAKTGT